MTLAEELFGWVDVRQRTPEEKLWRLAYSLTDDIAFDDLDMVRLTWDWYDASVEIYYDSNDVAALDRVPLAKLWDAGFQLVWLHPARCTKDGRRDHAVCRCRAKRRPIQEALPASEPVGEG